MELLLYFLLLAVSITFLVKSGMYIVHSVSAMARFIGLSQFVLSFLLVAFATSLPELSIGIDAALSGTPAVSLGDILGTNMVNLTLIIGFAAVVSGGLKIKDHESFDEEKWFVVILTLAPIALILDGTLSRVDWGILLSLFLLHVINLIRNQSDVLDKRKGRLSHHKHQKAKAKSKKGFIKKIGLLLVGMGVLMLSAHGITYAVEKISLSLGVPEFILGIILIGIGTSLPELSIATKSATGGQGGIPMGDILGSISMNSALVLGIVSVIHPITLPGFKSIAIIGGFTIVSILILYLLLNKRDIISRKEGGVLLVIYIAFLMTQIFSITPIH